MEPNTTFAMKKILFKNDGDFTLPDGSICTGRSYSPTLKVISQPIEQLPLIIPEISLLLIVLSNFLNKA